MEDGIITLSDIAAPGTAYHEAFHVVFNHLLDDNERAALLQEARSRFGKGLSEEELEEELAEEFRMFQMGEITDNRSLGRKILDFFKSLITKTTNWKNFKPSSMAYYQAIRRGEYANKTLKDVTVSRLNREQYTQEMKDILANAPRDSQGRLLAPNDKPSKLTERQYVHVRTKAFKEWFGDWENDPENASKVVDENGEPKPVMHGSPERNINIFDASKGKQKAIGSSASSESDKMNFFTDDEVTANAYMEDFNEGRPIYGKIYDVFLNIRNPKIIDYNGGNWNGETYEAEYYDPLFDQWVSLKAGVNDELDYFAQESDIYKKARQVATWHEGPWTDKDIRFKKINNTKTTNEEAELALKEGLYDGVIFLNVAEVGQGSSHGSITANDYVTFNTPNQIKSATDNVGTYSRSNDDIRYRRLGEVRISALDMVPQEERQILEKKGWTAEHFSRISQRERDKALECLGL